MKNPLLFVIIALMGTLASSCKADSSAVTEEPSVTLTIDDDTVFFGESVRVTASCNSETANYFWKVGGRANDATGWSEGGSDTALSIAAAGVVPLHVKVISNGKTATDSKSIMVLLTEMLNGSARHIPQNNSLDFYAYSSTPIDSLLWKVGGSAIDPTGWHRGDFDTTFLFTTVGVHPVHLKMYDSKETKSASWYVTVTPPAGTPVRYVGSRSSYYGFNPFPEPKTIATVYQKMAAKIPGSIPSSVWIVGGIGGSNCKLEFPNPDGKNYPNITFQAKDKHEPYLAEFDKIGAKVFLQVEAGMADIKTVMKLVLDRYGHHPSVAGFGIDIEWYPSPLDKNGDSVGTMSEWGVVSNEKAPIELSEITELESYAKSFNPNYRIFLKHWEPHMCGGKPTGSAMYLNSAQGFDSFDELLGSIDQSWTLTAWANAYKPNECGYQIGYDSDAQWWKLLSDPLKEITNRIDATFPTQINHIYWVDFTMYDKALVEYWK